MDKNNIDKDYFIRLLAERANFTLKDTRILLDALIEIFHDAILEGIPIDIRGFGHLMFIDTPSHKGFDAVRREPIDLPASRRIKFRLADNLRELVKNEKARAK